ncbi:MAG TPA: sensor domain-containing diguanylate cyclase, partial [Spirochaetia bacterium]|nr:sensor domain-containing diguanylate cyclase [Spirochaetia bacterium]
FIAVQIQVMTLVENALSGLNPSGIDIFVYDRSDPTAKLMLYAHKSRTRSGGLAAPATSSLYEWSGGLAVAGRDWQIVAESAPAFVRSHTYFLSWAVLGGGLFSTAIMFAFLLWYLRRARRVELIVRERTNELSSEIAEHKKTELSLTEAHEGMKKRMELVNQRSREIELLSEMGDLLQTCKDLVEAYDVVSRFGAELFPDESGVLFMFNDSRRFLESVGKWGKQAHGEPFFAADECWGLRRGRLHAVTYKGEGLICQHLDGNKELSYLCLPLTALGETIGVLHIQHRKGEDGATIQSGGDTAFEQSRQRLAVAMAEHAAMAFANLKLRETLRQQSIRDPLTLLFNRRYMEESVEREIHRARRNGTALGVIILDIDFFKKFNDTYGHDAGDLVLKAVAKIIGDSIRGEDIPCRFGGEEFVIILPSASLESSRQKAEALRAAVKQISVDYAGAKLPQITISLGVAVLQKGEGGGAVLLQAADEALYRAKESGRNRVEIGDP